MKLIASTDTDVFVTMTHDEWARLIGLSSSYSLKPEHTKPHERTVDSRLTQIADLEGLPNQATAVEQMAKSLTQTAARLKALVESTQFAAVKGAKK